MLTKGVNQRSVIPKGAVFAALKPLPKRFLDQAVVVEERSRIVQFIAGGNKANGVRSRGEVVNVGLLAGLPRRFGGNVSVSAAFDDGGDGRPKALADLVAGGDAALVFDRVVEESSDRLIFTAAVF